MIDSNQKVISHKVGLLNLAEELQNISQAGVVKLIQQVAGNKAFGWP